MFCLFSSSYKFKASLRSSALPASKYSIMHSKTFFEKYLSCNIPWLLYFCTICPQAATCLDAASIACFLSAANSTCAFSLSWFSMRLLSISRSTFRRLMRRIRAMSPMPNTPKRKITTPRNILSGSKNSAAFPLPIAFPTVEISAKKTQASYIERIMQATFAPPGIFLGGNESRNPNDS